ncbi:MAG: hypothetical protein H6635_05410 [Anaerolineales bacterium]|nr:hypothetical protein [Anaerolineales bacterium]MCB9144786.1 hypothetical protein [Anaerolineales bacterium]
MNIEEIKQAITQLSSDDLSHFREWFREHEGKVKAGELNDMQESLEEKLKRLRGSLKGKGGLKTLMEERRKESLL